MPSAARSAARLMWGSRPGVPRTPKNRVNSDLMRFGPSIGAFPSQCVSHSWHPPRMKRLFGGCDHGVIDRRVGNGDSHTVWNVATVIVVTGRQVRGGPPLEALGTAFCERNIHQITLSIFFASARRFA